MGFCVGMKSGGNGGWGEKCGLSRLFFGSASTQSIMKYIFVALADLLPFSLLLVAFFHQALLLLQLLLLGAAAFGGGDGGASADAFDGGGGAAPAATAVVVAAAFATIAAAAAHTQAHPPILRPSHSPFVPHFSDRCRISRLGMEVNCNKSTYGSFSRTSIQTCTESKSSKG